MSDPLALNKLSVRLEEDNALSYENDKEGGSGFFLDNGFTSEAHDPSNGKITYIPVDRLTVFKGQPYHVREGKELDALITSIQERGIKTALIVRKKGDKYEILSGHRRRMAAIHARLKEVPCVVVDCEDDDDALLYIIDSNQQRISLLPSEKATAVYMKYTILMKRRGGLRDCDGRTRTLIAKDIGMSEASISRCLHLYDLGEEFLNMIDNKRLKETLGSTLVYFMKPDTRMMVLNSVLAEKRAFDKKCLEMILEEDKRGGLTQERYDDIVNRYFEELEQKRGRKKEPPVEHIYSKPVVFADYDRFFPNGRNYSDQVKDAVIKKLLSSQPQLVAELAEEMSK